MIGTLLSFCAFIWTINTSPLLTPAPSPVTHLDVVDCFIGDRGRYADCSGRQLKTVPWQYLPPTLETIDLSYNKIRAIYKTDFSQFTNLHVIRLKFNNISHIDNKAFRQNTLLQELDLYNNSLAEIPAKAIQPLSNLKVLLLSNNLYKRVTLADSFANFAKLQSLSIGGPLVQGVRRGDLEPLRNLTLKDFAITCSSNLSYYEHGSLHVVQTMQMGIDMAIDQKPNVLVDILHDLANKNFTDLQFRNLFEFTYYTGSADIFQGLENITAHKLIFYRGKVNENLLRMLLLKLQTAQTIKRLRLQYIDFARSPSFADGGTVSSITDLRLDQLELWYISNPGIIPFDGHFTWLSKIKELSFQHVYMTNAPCEAWHEMRGAHIIDVSNNLLTSKHLYNRQCVYKGAMPSLQEFNVSNNDLTGLWGLSSLTKHFHRLKVMDVSNNMLGSAASSTGCVWSPSITRFIAHHNQFDSEALLCLPNTVEYLDLSHCGLDELDMEFFTKAVNLKELLLSGNKIKFIPPNWKSPSLKSLELDGNSFGVVTTGSFQDMPRLAKLKLGNNPYQCTCELHAFVEDTMSRQKVNLTDWPKNYHCYHPQPLLKKLILEYAPGRLACDIRLVIAVCVATTAGVLVGLMVLCYALDLPWYTKATYHIVRAKYRAYQERAAGEPGAFTYHAFISYSHSDADWVRERLLPCLEDGREPYRLCIHERDFTPGKWIIDNIIDNIENSRKVMFVLSRHFVNSEWCNYELYFAQQRAMGKTFSDVILIVKEPIDAGSLPSKYCKLKRMMSTKTYLEWPQQASQQAFFWEQLRSALGRPRPKTRSRTFSARSRGRSASQEDTQPLHRGEVVGESGGQR